MMLETIAFTEYPRQAGEWWFDKFTLGQTNLVVGRNATGKSRLLNVISALGRMLTGEMKEVLCAAKLTATFRHGEERWEYDLIIDSEEIVKESLAYNGREVIQRSTGGAGRIEAVDIEDKTVYMRFQVPRRQFAVAAKRDSAQHPYLEPLHEWGKAVRHFQFGYELRPHNLGLALKGGQKAEIDEKDTSSLVPIFDVAVKRHQDALVDAVIADMDRLGYHLSGLRIRKPDNTMAHPLIPGELVGVAAQEKELGVMTDQHTMSQGMFRTLSLLIQTTHYMLSGNTGLIIIDDVGEGLDFERSCILIDLLREKANRSAFQLLMSTNNRFVMNKVPLEEWCVLERDKGRVRVRNYVNSRAAFEQFKVTGLNNFDLFATNFLEGK